jgi:hypothetical protein
MRKRSRRRAPEVEEADRREDGHPWSQFDRSSARVTAVEQVREAGANQHAEGRDP